MLQAVVVKDHRRGDVSVEGARLSEQWQLQVAVDQTGGHQPRGNAVGLRANDEDHPLRQPRVLRRVPQRKGWTTG